MVFVGGVVFVCYGILGVVLGVDEINFDIEEICFVCKISWYFNKNIEFFINFECYYCMCRFCMECIFCDGLN